MFSDCAGALPGPAENSFRFCSPLREKFTYQIASATRQADEGSAWIVEVYSLFGPCPFGLDTATLEQVWHVHLESLGS